MTFQELQQLVALGEGVSLEFKHKVPRPARIAKELIALANTHGGRVLLGVNDAGTIVGVDDAAEELFVLRKANTTFCRPPVDFSAERILTPADRDVLLVEVPESREKPHFLESKEGDLTPYVRVNERSVEASPESVQIMREEDRQPQATLRFGEKESLLMRYLKDYGRITVEQYAQLANIPLYRASQTLFSMAEANVLRAHADRKEDYFTLAY